jgi:hypothetical protein
LFPLAQAPTLLYFVEKCILAVAYMKPCIGKGLGVNFGPEASYTDCLLTLSLDITYNEARAAFFHILPIYLLIIATY